MPIDFNDNLQIRAPKPIDDRYGPWETIEEGLLNVPFSYRYNKLTLNIAGVEYWFKDGLTDINLIIKQYNEASIESIVSGTNVNIDFTNPKNPIINVPIIGTVLTSNQLQIINTVPLVCSDEKTDIVASLTESKIKFVFQTQQSFTNIIGELNTPAVGGTFIIDVTKNGTSILSTYLTFDSGETSTRTALIPKVLTTSPVSFDIGDYVEVFVRIVGALVPGKGLKIYLM